MYSKRTAPSVATRTDQTLKPVVPDPPKTPTTKPPTEAPAMPRRTVTIKRPGSEPGTIRRATIPAMAPTRIQLIRPTPFLLLSRSSLCVGDGEAGSGALGQVGG